MLRLPLNQLAAISLLRSDRWLFHLLTDSKSDNADIAIKALLDYQYYTQRKNDNQIALGQVYQANAGSHYQLDFIQNLAGKHLIWQGNRFEVKREYLNQWQAICAYIDPVIILSWLYAEKLQLNQLTAAQLAGLPQCPQALIADDNREYADNHVHHGGNGSSRKALLDFTFEPMIMSNKAKKANIWPTLAEFNFLSTDRFNRDELPRLLNALFYYLYKRLLGNDNTELPQIDLPITCRQFDSSLKTQIELSPINNLSIECMKLSFQQKDIDNSYLLLFTGLFYAARYSQSEDHSWQVGFKAFIHTSQILRAYMVHAGIGLGYFVEFFRFGKRRGKEVVKYQDYAFNADMSRQVYREFKVSPGAVSRKKLEAIAKSIDEKQFINQIHHCIHFTRSGDYADKLQRQARQKLTKERDQLIGLLSSYEIQNYQPKNIKNERADHAVNLANLIRGIDVAGDETQLPIEVFAPTIRVLRSCPWKNNYSYYQPPPRPHLSIHVGEDFSHLLTGLRHIDETVKFCEMSYGDRLGHGLALGIDPLQWSNRQGVAFESAGAHLDNLVWLHHMVVKTAMSVPSILPVLQILVVKISRWSDYVYGKPIEPNLLFVAWMLRRNCPEMYAKLKQSDLPYVKTMMPDFGENSGELDQAKDIWLQYYMSNQIEGKDNRQMSPVTIYHIEEHHPDGMISTIENHLQDFFCQAELQAITAVQDYLMNVYDQKGIMIEACPSSNIYTGRFEDYHEHPLFRWCPPQKAMLGTGTKYNQFGIRNGPMKVCINTDDAGLFPTTIVNEHRVIKQAAVQNFDVSNEEAQLWIDRLRDNGVEAFKRNRQQVF